MAVTFTTVVRAMTVKATTLPVPAEAVAALDTEPRTVEVPDDLATALDEKPGARAAFDALSYSARKEHVRQVNEAKAQETRERRVANIVAKVGGSG